MGLVRFFAAPENVPLVGGLCVALLFCVGAAVARLARRLGRALAPSEDEATSRAELVGQVGVVISSRVDEAFGEIRIRDKTGHDLRLVCRLTSAGTEGRQIRVMEKDSVVVVDCERGELVVAPFDVDVGRAEQTESIEGRTNGGRGVAPEEEA